MFISTLLLIPFIVFGFKHSDKKFIGLKQTKKSLLILLTIEILYWIVLMLLLKKPDPNIAGQGSFSWMYCFEYEKGIFPLMYFTGLFNWRIGVLIDAHYQFLYLITALLMDYIILFLVSPRIIKLKRKTVK